MNWKLLLIKENGARLFAAGLVLGLVLVVSLAGWIDQAQAITIRARLPGQGGFLPADLTAEAGQPLHIRLTSEDVVHGFALGQSDQAPVDLQPGEMVELTLVFERPGKYTFYCTRWCGVDHWRMRGTIEVSGAGQPVTQPAPLYLALGQDIDAAHPAAANPQTKPSAQRGSELGVPLPAKYRELAYTRAHSPAATWQALRAEPALEQLTDAQLWDLVAWSWLQQTTPETLETGEALYAANCAACHGEQGAGDGVFANDPRGLDGSGQQTSAAQSSGAQPDMTGMESMAMDDRPTDFTAAANLLGATPAILQGKIVRGGMGTGMPYWGPVFTEAQTWALVDYLWTFQFERGAWTEK